MKHPSPQGQISTTPSQGGRSIRSSPFRTQNRCMDTASVAKPFSHGSVTVRVVSPVFSAV